MLSYRRHFSLLALIVAALSAYSAVADLSGAGIGGMVTIFGFYGGVYSTLIAMTCRAPAAWRRAGAFIAIGSVLCMLNVAASRIAGHVIVAWMGSAGPAVLLGVASALGAAAFGVSLRRLLRLPLPGAAVAPLAAGCAASTLIVFRSGLYLGSPGLWFAASWWLTFSAGLWITDALRWNRSGPPPIGSDH